LVVLVVRLVQQLAIKRRAIRGTFSQYGIQLLVFWIKQLVIKYRTLGRTFRQHGIQPVAICFQCRTIEQWQQ
ncbi:MAG TPA: hypothetical protein PKD64_18595, partial [Pirellulaceae bacterium]|nr:hypothetical protein [Pirellulaceae bacterium]HMO94200.1 hypothetical protein [Pirellulaceae bacterium]